MNFLLSEEQQQLKTEVIDFVKYELNESSVISFSKEKWKKCSEFGLLGLNIDELYGGMNLDFLTSAIILETLGYACEDSGFIFTMTNHLWVCQQLINKFGSDEIKQKYLHKMVSGDCIGCFAITEVDSGSDAFHMNTIAEAIDGAYILNGNKMFISNAPIADIFVVIAKTSGEHERNKYTAFIIEKDSEGVQIGKTIEKMGLESCPMAEVSFADCKVSQDQILLAKDKGEKVASYALQMERIFEFASHIGSMERIMERCIKYANERQQFGKKIKEYQAVSGKIADMKVKIELAQSYLYKTAWMLDVGKNVFLNASVFKLFVSESYIQTCLDALQIHGAYGYCKEYGLERELRDAIASAVYSGTNEIQKNIIFQLADI